MTDDRCEWNPKDNVPALSPPSPNDCTNRAVLLVGARGDWRLCVRCAQLPGFQRYTKRKEIACRSTVTTP